VRRTPSETRTGHKFERPRSGRGRSIRLSGKAVEALRNHSARQVTEKLWLGSLWQDNGLVFPTSTGTTTSATNLLGRYFRALLREAGLTPVRLYELLRTCATILLMVGKHLKYVQELLGRASISVTLDTYKSRRRRHGRGARRRDGRGALITYCCRIAATRVPGADPAR
jgi:integrase